MINEIIEMLEDGKVGAVFGGSPEMGSRALGHRSIIADPRLVKGKDIVNKVKNREWFRPFAASVLVEEASNWFDMGKLEDSPWMLFAVPVLEDKRYIVPAVIHVDGTCRVQTVSKDLGVYYDIIKAFFNSTGVPMLLNTSLNLAGMPLIHTKEEARSMLHNSSLDFVYFVDDNKVET